MLIVFLVFNTRLIRSSFHIIYGIVIRIRDLFDFKSFSHFQ